MKQFLVFLFLLCAVGVSAQDVIVKKDGSTIVCRVVELTSSEITYKKWSDLNGSNYVMNRADASAINYEDGRKVSLSEATNLYQPHNQNDGVQQYNDKALLKLDAAISRPDKKVRRLRTTGWVGGGVLFVAGVLFFSSSEVLGGDDWLIDDEQALPISLACIGGAAVWTTSFLLVANHVKKQNQLVSIPIFQHEFKISDDSFLSVGTDMFHDKTLGYNTLGLGLRYNF